MIYSLDKPKTWMEWTCERLAVQHLIDYIEIKWSSKKMTVAVGRAFVKPDEIGGFIVLSQPIWPRHVNKNKHVDYERRKTVVHETCHIIAENLYGFVAGQPKVGHGEKWGKLMRLCGFTPDRFHDTSLPDRKMGLISFKCGCKDGCMLGPIQAKRFLQHKTRYRCSKCKVPLVAHRRC